MGKGDLSTSFGINEGCKRELFNFNFSKRSRKSTKGKRELKSVLAADADAAPVSPPLESNSSKLKNASEDQGERKSTAKAASPKRSDSSKQPSAHEENNAPLVPTTRRSSRLAASVSPPSLERSESRQMTTSRHSVSRPNSSTKPQKASSSCKKPILTPNNETRETAGDDSRKRNTTKTASIKISHPGSSKALKIKPVNTAGSQTPATLPMEVDLLSKPNNKPEERRIETKRSESDAAEGRIADNQHIEESNTEGSGDGQHGHSRDVILSRPRDKITSRPCPDPEVQVGETNNVVAMAVNNPRLEVVSPSCSSVDTVIVPFTATTTGGIAGNIPGPGGLEATVTAPEEEYVTFHICEDIQGYLGLAGNRGPYVSFSPAELQDCLSVLKQETYVYSSPMEGVQMGGFYSLPRGPKSTKFGMIKLWPKTVKPFESTPGQVEMVMWVLMGICTIRSTASYELDGVKYLHGGEMKPGDAFIIPKKCFFSIENWSQDDECILGYSSTVID